MAEQRTMWWAAALAVATLCAGGAVSEIYSDYRATHANIAAQTLATAKLADAHAERALSYIRDMFDRLSPIIAATDRNDPAAVLDLRDRFQDMAVASKSVGTIWMADAQGVRWLNNLANDAPASIAASDYFVAAREARDTLIVGRANMGRRYARPRFTLSRAIASDDGAFRGVLTMGVNVDYFTKLYASVLMGPNVQIVAFNIQGDVLAKTPSANDAIVQIARRSIDHNAQGSIDTDAWVVSIAPSQAFPIVLAAVTDVGQAMEAWRRRSWQVGLLSLLMSVGFALLTMGGIRSARREKAATTDLRNLNEHLEERVRDRTESLNLLLRELNHRVKNNLQIVGSLIRLQSRAQKDPSVTAVLESVNQRLFAVADLHSELETGGTGFASSKQFFERIVRRIIEVSETPGRAISVTFDLDDVALPVDQAVPLGLILNETVTNSVKHAFANAGGVLEVAFKVDGGIAELTVRDDGRSTTEATAGGLGARIVALLTRQIHGAVTVEDKNGRIVRVVAPLARGDRPDTVLARAAE